MASLQLDIVTPDRLVISQEVDYVAAPGIEGEFGILPGHVPFISALSLGCLHYNAGGKTDYVFVAGGFAEVSDNKVTILAECAECACDIDYNRAEAALKRAQERIARRDAEINHSRAVAALSRATTRLSLQSRV